MDLPKPDDAGGSVELATLTEQGDTLEPIPLTFIEGWAAGTSAKIFSGLDDLLNEDRAPGVPARRLLVIKCGAYSSLWDRAHEVYYALKGGRCDYGADHSEEHGHARYGREHKAGAYENWSEEYPLHFAGHSFGGSTIVYLQQLIMAGILPGSPAMMKSIVTISSPLRGTPLAASLGQLDGPTAGQKRFSLSWMLAVGIHAAKTANVIANDIYDFGGDQWMETKHPEDESSRGLIDSFTNYFPGKGMGFSADSAGFDMLVEQMEKYNASTELCSETFYRSYTATTPIPLYLPPLAYCHYLVTHYPHKEPVSDDWRDNDGFIPHASQMHPKHCEHTTCLHIPKEIVASDEPPPLPMVWHVRHYEDTTHFGLVDYLWKLRTSTKTRRFWNELGGWLRRVDEESSAASQEGVKAYAVSIIDA